MAPDIAFANVAHISPENLTVKEIVGTGGFGKVYKGYYLFIIDNNYDLLICCVGALTTHEGVKDVAVKEANMLEYEEDFQMLQHEVFLMRYIITVLAY